jgi:hypothetical protein
MDTIQSVEIVVEVAALHEEVVKVVHREHRFSTGIIITVVECEVNDYAELFDYSHLSLFHVLYCQIFNRACFILIVLFPFYPQLNIKLIN